MIYYRVSDKSYPKVKLPGATKANCFWNFLDVFNMPRMEVIADHCTDQTLSMIPPSIIVHQTELGNAGSLRFALDLAATQPDDEIVYFVEDDYLHRISFDDLTGASMDLISEGLQIADYVTLYDHPDKYSSDYDGGEVCKVMRTKSTHWRTTVSTCMTFATTSKVIKEDRDVWNQWIKGIHPHDHQVFLALGKLGRRLVTCIPGRAVHIDSTWGGMTAIEPWAVNDMIKKTLEAIQASNDPIIHAYKEQVIHMPVDSLCKLKMLTVLVDKI
jgi:hypothetical protein